MSRDYAHAVLGREALVLKVVMPRPVERLSRAALICCPPLIGAAQRAPADRLLALMLPVLVPLLCRDKELVVADGQADLLMRMSAATTGYTQTGETFSWGRSRTKPRMLLKSEIPVRIWVERDDALPDSWRSIWSVTRSAQLRGILLHPGSGPIFAPAGR